MGQARMCCFEPRHRSMHLIDSPDVWSLSCVSAAQ